MRTITIILLLLLAQSTVFAQNWLWGESISGNDLLETEGVGVDSSNNIYILNELNGTSTVQGNTITSAGGKDIQLSKFDINGNLQWTRGIGGTNTDDPKNLFTDVNGNSYITGSFNGTSNFSTITINAQNNKDAFLAKYDANGNIVWAKDIAWGENVQKGTCVNVSNSGYITMGGFFKDTIIFGDTVGAANSDTLIYKKNKKNSFIAKFNNNGNYIFSKQIYTNNASMLLNALSLYNGDNFYLGGYFTDSLFIDNDTLVADNHSSDIAIINFDAFGNVIWAKRFGDDNVEKIFGIESDESNNIYITGAFQDSLIIGNDTLYGTNATAYDLFVAKLDPNGNELWATAKGSSYNDYGWSVTYRNSKLQVSGSFSDTIIWDNDTITTSSLGDVDAFFATLDVNNGNLLNIVKVQPGGSLVANEEPRDIVVDNYGNTYMAGRYASDYLYFGNDTLTNANPGQYDVFVAKYGCQEVAINFASTAITCAGYNDGTITAVPSINNTYTYLWNNNDTTQNIDTLTEGVYTVTITNSFGCEYIDSTLLTHIPTLETNMSSDTITINCVDGQDGQAIVTPIFGVVDSGFSYLWDNGITDSLVATLDTGLHYVTVTDYCGSKTDSVFVTHKPTLTANLAAHITTVPCEDSQIGEAFVDYQNGVYPYHFVWSNGDTTQSVHDLNVGKHYVTITDYCNVPLTDSITVYHLPKMFSDVAEAKPASCTDTADGTAIILAHSGVPPYTYQWDTSATGIDSLGINLKSGWHYITISDACGSVADSVEIKIKPQLQVSYLLDKIKCYNDSNASITVITQDGVSPVTIKWSDTTETSYILDSLKSGTYYYTVSDYCGSISDTITITQPKLLTDTVVVTNESETGKSDGVVNLTVIGGTSPYSYYWSNGGVAEDLVYVAADTFYVTITDANNCYTADTAIVLIDKKTITIVNAFSPNNDGVNDVWNIKNIDAFPNCSVNVYNQWGTIVFESTGYKKPWDGTKNGKMLPSDTYYYIIDLKDGTTKPYTGSVTIVK